ncbi:MAG: DUF5916 domain-containing protein [Pseudomonadota bacterium]
MALFSALRPEFRSGVASATGCSRAIRRVIPVVLTLLGSLLGAAVQAQSEPEPISYQIPHTDQTPVIDGVFSAEEWRNATRVELVNETFPGQNIAPPVQTEVYIMEDGESFLAAFVAHDPDPSKIRAFYRDRDRAFQDDCVGFVIDTFNDERRAFEFFINPLGVQMDLIQDDVSKREDDSWNALWDSAGKINDTGFVGEMRIPLKQLRLPSGLAQQTWGIDLLRFYPREARHRISNNISDYSVSCYLCQFKKAQGFGPIEQGTNLQVIPTVTSLWNQTRPKPATDAWQRNDPDFEPAVDVRWGINEDMILNATLNPDFSQVEADQAQLDVNNTFQLFFPERREFFLDGAEYFNTINSGNNNGNGSNTLVYTRNINDPQAGLKLTGKSDNHTYAVMAANDERTGFLIPGNQGSRVATIADTKSQDLAARYRYDLGRKFTVGTLMTARSADEYDNTVISSDFNWQVAASDRVVAQVMGSESEYPIAIQTGFAQKPEMNDTAWLAAYNHQGQNWNWNVTHSNYGEDFRADLGFIGRVNYIEDTFNPSYTWLFKPGGFFNRVSLWSFFEHGEDQQGLDLQDAGRVGLWFNGRWQSNAEYSFGKQETYFNGRYFDLDNSILFGQIQPWGGAQFRINIRAGDAIDYANTQAADNLTISPNFSLQLSRHLQIQLNHNHQELDVAGGRLFTTDLSDIRLTYQFDTRSFIRAVVIYSDTERDPSLYRVKIDKRSRSLATQLLYSYRFSAQTRFFVGYSDNATQDATLTGLEPTYRAVFAKFSYAWQY